MLQISQLFIYPIKSLGGIAVASAMVTDRGLEHDRRWMLIDHGNRFMTQREMPELALFRPTMLPEGISVHHPQGGSFLVPFEPQTDDEAVVTIWQDNCRARLVSQAADDWFSSLLKTSCRLVYMPDAIQRLVERPYAEHNEITSFSDAYPFLLLGQSSLDDLNARLPEPVPVSRFRPNIVFSGAPAYEEDRLAHFRVGDLDFFGVKPCARCVVTTIDQATAIKGKEPLRTLATYRTKNNNIYFGQNLLHRGLGRISTGDEMKVTGRQPPLQFG